MHTKAALRSELLAVRRSLAAADVAAWGGAIQQAALHLHAFRQANTVALYAASTGEVPTSALFTAARTAGKRVVFPSVERGALRLRFHLVEEPSRDLAPRTLGLLEPLDHCWQADLSEIDLFVVPGVAFTASGERLGHGKGYYDATLWAAPRALRVALAFTHQLRPQLPTEPHDVRMDWVVTQDGVHPGMLGNRA